MQPNQLLSTCADSVRLILHPSHCMISTQLDLNGCCCAAKCGHWLILVLVYSVISLYLITLVITPSDLKHQITLYSFSSISYLLPLTPKMLAFLKATSWSCSQFYTFSWDLLCQSTENSPCWHHQTSISNSELLKVPGQLIQMYSGHNHLNIPQTT